MIAPDGTYRDPDSLLLNFLEFPMIWRRIPGIVLTLWLLPNVMSAAGVIVAAGGGSEGDLGDETAWSYPLYKRMIDNGDVNGDGLIKVAILSNYNESPWMSSYFRWLGADEAVNVRVSTRADANNPDIVDEVETADVIFLKGGDQGKYYDFWNDTRLETHIRTVVDVLQGAIGGTSAGAASLSEYCLASGKSLDSIDVRQDALTPSLNDVEGGSGIHTDFLNVVPRTYIDTHYTTRGRNGRMLGVLGKAVQDGGDAGILAIGIDERTGIVITGQTLEVIGTGAVDLIHQTSSSVLVRESKRPLYYTHLHLDRLTEGWRYDLANRSPDLEHRPTSAVAVTYAGDGATNSGALTLQGHRQTETEKFARTIDYDPAPYATQPGTTTPGVLGSLGLVNAYQNDFTGAIHEAVFRALYDFPDHTGFLVAYQGQLTRSSSEPDVLMFSRNSGQRGVEAATIVIDGRNIAWKDLSPRVSSSDTGSETLNAAALIGVRLHVLAESGARGGRYNTRTHTLTQSLVH